MANEEEIAMYTRKLEKAVSNSLYLNKPLLGCFFLIGLLLSFILELHTVTSCEGLNYVDYLGRVFPTTQVNFIALNSNKSEFGKYENQQACIVQDYPYTKGTEQWN